MTNEQRAEGLEKVGLLQAVVDGDTYRIPGKNWVHDADGMMAEGDLLLYLLRELPKLGFEVEMFNRIGFGFWTVLLKKPEVFWLGKNDDSLLALVDAVIAANGADE